MHLFRAITLVLSLAAILAVLAGGVALLVSERRGTTYVATVVWTARENAAAPDASAVEDGLAADPVLERALDAVGIAEPSPDDVARLRGAVDVHVRGDGRVELQVRADTSEGAVSTAAAMASAVEGFVRDDALGRARNHVSELGSELAALDRRIRSLQVLGGSAGGEAVDELIRERRVLVGELAAAEARASSLERDAPLPRSDVTVRRSLLDRATSVIPAASIGAIVGALVGILLIARSRSSGPRAMRGDVLAVFPRVPGASPPEVREAAARLADAVVRALPDHRRLTLLVTHAEEGNPAAYVTARLAEEFAWRGRRTLLVDADLRNPSLVRRYGIDGLAGVGTTLDWLQDPTTEHEVATVELGEGMSLDLVPQFVPINVAPGADEALGEGLIAATTSWARYDVVVLHASSLLSDGVIRSASSHVSGAIAVGDRDALASREFAALQRTVKRGGGRFLGLVRVEGTSSEEDAPTLIASARPARSERRA